MKAFIFLLVIYSLPVSAQTQVGVINDPDGYTNIRKGKGTNYPIVGSIERGERFEFYKSDSNWWMVKLGDSIQGFMYSDRIKPLEEVKCACYESHLLGSPSEMSPSFTAKLANGNKVSICGYLQSKLSSRTIEISEFAAFDCATEQILAEYGAVQYCRVENKNNELIITELINLPVGKDWQFNMVPYAERTITSKDLQIIVSDVKPVLEVPKLDDEKIEEFLQSVRDQQGGGKLENWERDIMKLLISALHGNQEAADILLNLESHIDFKTDGAQAETYGDALAAYRWMKK